MSIPLPVAFFRRTHGVAASEKSDALPIAGDLQRARYLQWQDPPPVQSRRSIMSSQRLPDRVPRRALAADPLPCNA